MVTRSYYAILGVARDAEPEVIEAAYRALMKKHHPDRSMGRDDRAKDINEAYAVLGDAAKRRSYDRSLGIASGREVAGSQSPPKSQRASTPDPAQPDRPNPTNWRVLELGCLGVMIASAIGIMLGVSAGPESDRTTSNAVHSRADTGGQGANQIAAGPHPAQATAGNAIAADQKANDMLVDATNVASPVAHRQKTNEDDWCINPDDGPGAKCITEREAYGPPRPCPDGPFDEGIYTDPQGYKWYRDNHTGECFLPPDEQPKPQQTISSVAKPCPRGMFHDSQMVDAHGRRWFLDPQNGRCYPFLLEPRRATDRR
jgi:hypothetical protein